MYWELTLKNGDGLGRSDGGYLLEVRKQGIPSTSLNSLGMGVGNDERPQ